MKRQRAFLDNPSGSSTKRAKTVSIVPLQPKLNKTQEIQVRRLISKQAETKTWVKGALSQSASLVHVITSVTDISLGQTDNTRIGNHVHMKNLNGRVTILNADATNVIRVIIFKWKENDTFNVPTAAQVLANGPSGGPDVYSTYNRDSPGNYTIIKDFFFVGNGNSAASNLIQKKEFKVKLSGKTQFYSDVGTSGTNKYYIMYQSDSAAVNHPTVSYNLEFDYTDS